MFNKSLLKIVRELEVSDMYKKYVTSYRAPTGDLYCQTVVYSKDRIVRTNSNCDFCKEVLLRKRIRSEVTLNVIDSFQDRDFIYLISDYKNTLNFEVMISLNTLDYNTRIVMIYKLFGIIIDLSIKGLHFLGILPQNIEITRDGNIIIDPNGLNNPSYFAEVGGDSLHFLSPNAIRQHPTGSLGSIFYSMGVFITKMLELDESAVEQNHDAVDLVNILTSSGRDLHLSLAENEFAALKRHPFFNNIFSQPLPLIHMDSIVWEEPIPETTDSATYLSTLFPDYLRSMSRDPYCTLFRASNVRYLRSTTLL